MSLLDTASLIVTPNGYKEGKLYSVIPSDGSGDLSVTRATTATRVNSAGLVELVPYNLLQYSQDFSNAIWGAFNATITSNNTTAPDGTLTADKIEISSASLARVQQISTATNLTIGSPCTFSVWIKSVSGTGKVGFRSGQSGTNTLISFTNEWVRYEWTFNAADTAEIPQFCNSTLVSGADSTPTFFVWGAQLVEGSTAKDYQKTETRLNIPRLDYSNGTCPSLLVEPQRTNILTWSSSFDNAAWIKSSGGTGSLPVITPNTTISPSGVQDADTIFLNSGSGTTPSDQSQFYQTMSVVSGTIYTMSFYAKGSVGGEQRMVRHAGAGSYTKITLTNQWARYSVTETAVFTGVVTPAFLIRRGLLEPINASATFYLWGAQVEAGNYSTSYIPTTSASVTRNADVISKTGISSLIGQTEGTFFVDVNLDETSDYNGWFLKENATFDTFVFLQRESNGIIAVGYYGSGALKARIETAPSQPSGHYKIAFGYKNNDFVMYVNGTQIGTDTSGSVSGLMDYIDLHWTQTGTNHQHAVALWKERKDNAFLAQLTTI